VGDERVKGVADRRLGHAPHANDRLLDGAEFAVKGLAGALRRCRGAISCGAGEDLLDLAFDSALIVCCWHIPSALLR
jgi:hypothetical protein